MHSSDIRTFIKSLSVQTTKACSIFWLESQGRGGSLGADPTFSFATVAVQCPGVPVVGKEHAEFSVGISSAVGGAKRTFRIGL